MRSTCIKRHLSKGLWEDGARQIRTAQAQRLQRRKAEKASGQVPLRLCKGPEGNAQGQPGGQSVEGKGGDSQKMVPQRQRGRGSREVE